MTKLCTCENHNKSGWGKMGWSGVEEDDGLWRKVEEAWGFSCFLTLDQILHSPPTPRCHISMYRHEKYRHGMIMALAWLHHPIYLANVFCYRNLVTTFVSLVLVGGIISTHLETWSTHKTMYPFLNEFINDPMNSIPHMSQIYQW